MVMLWRRTVYFKVRWIIVTQVASLKEGEWSCYGGDQFKRMRMVIICRDGQFNLWRMVMLQKWISLMEGELLCYRGGQFNGGRMVVSYGGGQISKGRMNTFRDRPQSSCFGS